MGERNTLLDWQILEEGAAWPPHSPASPVRGPGPRRYSRRQWWYVLACLATILLPALVLGYAEIRRAGQAMGRVENDVRAAVTTEDLMHRRQAQSSSTVVAPLAGPAQPHAILAYNHSHAAPGQENTQASTLEARKVEIRGDYAMVEVWTHESNRPWLHAPYRQTGFYQGTAQGWLQANPPDVFYQPLDTLQAGRFTFIYGPRDARAVREAATQVEAVDAALRGELGLSPTDEALSIEVIKDHLFTLDPVELMGTSEGTTLYAPSPALLQLPASLSEGNALLQLIAGLLITHDLDEAADAPQVCNWHSLRHGLRLWLLSEHSDLPSQARYEVEIFLEFKRAQGRIPYLIWVAPDHNACSPYLHARSMAGSYTYNTVASTLVAYAVAAYGRDRLPALIEGMKRHDSWEALIPAVYGVSAAEFEAGWQAMFLSEKRE